MMTHTLLSRQTSRYGGRKSPGREYNEPTEMHHWTPEEMAARIAELEADGWYLTVTILAHKDKRRAVARERYPVNWCPECGEQEPTPVQMAMV